MCQLAIFGMTANGRRDLLTPKVSVIAQMKTVPSKYHLLLRIAWTRWSADDRPKRTTKRTQVHSVTE